MKLNKILKNTFLVVAACLVLSACATSKKSSTGQMQGDVYTGTDTVEYLASGVPDRVFFATNESILTTASRETLRKQAAWLRKNSNITSPIQTYARKVFKYKVRYIFIWIFFKQYNWDVISDWIIF